MIKLLRFFVLIPRYGRQKCDYVIAKKVITCAKFDIGQLRGFGVAGGRISGFPLDFVVDYYNTLTLPSECVILCSKKGTQAYV